MIRNIPIALSVILVPPFVSAGQTPVPAPDVTIEQRLNEQVPLDLLFRDESGRAVELREYFGHKPVILVLAYYRCPRLCSVVLNSLTESLRGIDYEIGDQFTVVTVSFDAREKPELAAAKKAAYVELYGWRGAAEGWHFLTGDETSIKPLADAVGFRYTFDPKTDQFAHSSGIMILTPEGKISRYFYGVTYLPRDLRFGLEDAAAGNIGAPVTRPLRLLCFAYDPATGKYTLMTMRLVRLSGLLTVVVLGGFLVRAWRRKEPASRAA
jgi:protein SCO1